MTLSPSFFVFLKGEVSSLTVMLLSLGSCYGTPSSDSFWKLYERRHRVSHHSNTPVPINTWTAAAWHLDGKWETSVIPAFLELRQEWVKAGEVAQWGRMLAIELIARVWFLGHKWWKQRTCTMAPMAYAHLHMCVHIQFKLFFKRRTLVTCTS